MKELMAYRFKEFIDEPIALVCLHKDEHVLNWNTMIVEHIYGREDEMGVGSRYSVVYGGSRVI
ncbi:hypothetical protein Q9251_21355 [Alkalihalobacillus macyae]|uniref:hypothetical protein n=1 Tax=Guptibacillus hwajinpoensis TaxID=208199 RepID=UPI00273BFC05|nr:hypothetical protein [Alkalihalobacillus macyae]MDP4553406.1 hypothetical protein [Alkalihalobacillus macyae]